MVVRVLGVTMDLERDARGKSEGLEARKARGCLFLFCAGLACDAIRKLKAPRIPVRTVLAVLKDVSDQAKVLVLLMRLRLTFPVG